MDKENKSREELIKIVNWYDKKYGPYIEKRGKDNWKNLFRKPTLLEWVILIMLMLSLFMAWAYIDEITYYQNIVGDPISFCSHVVVNISLVEFNEDLNKAENG